MPATVAAPTPTVSNPAIAAKCTIHRVGPTAVGLTRTSCTSPAAATMAWPAAGSSAPRPPTMGDWFGPTAHVLPRSPTPTILMNSSARTPDDLGATEKALETRGLAIAARVAHRKISVGEPPDRLAATELVVIIRGDQLMATSLKLVER